jgi:hypothetical protein
LVVVFLSVRGAWNHRSGGIGDNTLNRCAVLGVRRYGCDAEKSHERTPPEGAALRGKKWLRLTSYCFQEKVRHPANAGAYSDACADD